MSWIDTIREQPKEKKLKLIWICVGIAGVILILLWIITAQVQKDVPRDTSIFKTVGDGVRNLRQNYNKPINQ